jgi:hypothetical protein
MNTPKIQKFFEELWRNLHQLPLDEKKKALEHFQKRVNEAIKRNPNSSPAVLESGILVNLGEPKDAARHYLKSKKIDWRDPDEPSQAEKFFRKHTVFLAVISLLIATAVYFTFNEPSPQMKELAQKVVAELPIDSAKKIFSDSLPSGRDSGGSNSDAQATASWSAAPSGKINLKPGESGPASGEKLLFTEPIRKISVEFGKGRWAVSWNSGADLMWNCYGEGDLQPEVQGPFLSLRSNAKSEFSCSLVIPASLGLKITGQEGEISLSNPDGGLNVELGTGNVVFQGAKKNKYRFQNKVDVGLIGNLASSSESDAIPVFIHVKNGKILGQ